MAEKKKKGIFLKLFGGNKSSCCSNVQIVEDSEEDKKEPDEKGKNSQKTPIQKAQ